MLDLLISTVGQGLQWSVLALGVFLTFRILDIADLSVEGSFPLGAAAAATAITSGLGLPAAFVLALIAGALAGAVTGILTTKLRIPALLAGILTMIGLYSVNLHVMGKSNIGLLQDETVFTILENSLGLSVAVSGLAVGLIFAALIAVILGSIVYRLVIAFVLEMGMPPNDLKLFTAVLVAFALALPLIKEKCAGLRAHG